MTSKSCSRSPVSWWRLALIARSSVVCTLFSAGCNLSDAGMSAYHSSDQFFAVLALEHHAINLSTVAPYDTVTLHTTRAMADGSEVPGEVTYSVSSPSISVTNGVLKAESPVTRAMLRVTLTHGAVTRTDSAFVSVIATAPDRLRDFGLRLPAGDSAKTGVDISKMIPLIRESEAGANLSTLLVSLRSSDTTIAAMTLSQNIVSITPRRPGRVMLSTSTYAFGTTWRDSLVFTVGWPLTFTMWVLERYPAGSVTPLLDFAARDITIGIGGCVVWQNNSEELDIDLQFDNPAQVDAPEGSICPEHVQVRYADIGGNIAPFHKIPLPGGPILTEEDLENYINAFVSAYRARAFSAPGVFTYRSALHGTTGRVRVCDERNDTTCAPPRLGSWY